LGEAKKSKSGKKGGKKKGESNPQLTKSPAGNERGKGRKSQGSGMEKNRAPSNYLLCPTPTPILVKKSGTGAEKNNDKQNAKKNNYAKG